MSHIEFVVFGLPLKNEWHVLLVQCEDPTDFLTGGGRGVTEELFTVTSSPVELLTFDGVPGQYESIHVFLVRNFTFFCFYLKKFFSILISTRNNIQF